jgi:hypothetical protein
MSESRESFQPYLVEQFKKEEIKDILVNCKDERIKEQIFTEEEFEKIWEHTGGHQGTLYTLHDRLVDGETLDGIIIAQKRDFFGWLRGVIVDVDKNKEEIIKKRKDFLLKLQENNFQIEVENPKDDSTIYYFLMKNVLFYDGKYIFPQNKPIQNAIEEYIVTFIKK